MGREFHRVTSHVEGNALDQGSDFKSISIGVFYSGNYIQMFIAPVGNLRATGRFGRGFRAVRDK